MDHYYNGLKEEGSRGKEWGRSGEEESREKRVLLGSREIVILLTLPIIHPVDKLRGRLESTSDVAGFIEIRTISSHKVDENRS